MVHSGPDDHVRERFRINHGTVVLASTLALVPGIFRPDPPANLRGLVGTVVVLALAAAVAPRQPALVEAA